LEGLETDRSLDITSSTSLSKDHNDHHLQNKRKTHKRIERFFCSISRRRHKKCKEFWEQEVSQTVGEKIQNDGYW
jgi:hypothetical protein